MPGDLDTLCSGLMISSNMVEWKPNLGNQLLQIAPVFSDYPNGFIPDSVLPEDRGIGQLY